MDELEKKIKKTFLNNFYRDINNEELNEIKGKLLSQSRELHEKIKGFSEERYKHYLGENFKNIEIFFSPDSISDQASKLIGEKGEDDFEKPGKYRRTKELIVASRFMIGVKKLNGDEWMIKGQDQPDIILAKPNSQEWLRKPFYGVQLEVMEIPQLIREKWSDKIAQQAAGFIKKTKFDLRFGSDAHLLVLLRFDAKNLDINELAIEIKKLSGNPYQQIWVMALTDPEGDTFMIANIHPSYKFVSVDLNKEAKDLLY
jgi:hypothetical protein